MEIIKDIQNAFLPELVIFIFIVINIILSLFIRKNTYKIAKTVNLSAFILCAASMFLVQINPDYFAFNRVFVSNIYTLTFKVMILLSALLVILLSDNLIQEKMQKSFEFFSVFLAGVLASFSLVSSNDFISAFISLELLSISCYFLTSFRKNEKSKESSLKYLITGAGSSAVLLLGISYLYGLYGKLNFTEINDLLSFTDVNLFFILSCLLMICSLMFKLGCIPFNNWIIDVYNGASYGICAYLSLIPKIAALGFISRLFVFIFSFSPILEVITALISVYTIFYASIGAIKQNNIKRLYAYSSIIHSAFILLAISAINVYSLSSMIFYVFTYIFMNTGIWTASVIYTKEYQTDNINDYRGLFYKRPYFTTALCICLISLAGLPLTGGFLSKIYLFSALSRIDFIYIIILFFTLIASIICVFVYFKIIKLLFELPVDLISVTKQSRLSKFILYFCAFLTILIGIFPDKIIKLAQIIAYYI